MEARVSASSQHLTELQAQITSVTEAVVAQEAVRLTAEQAGQQAQMEAQVCVCFAFAPMCAFVLKCVCVTHTLPLATPLTQALQAEVAEHTSAVQQQQQLHAQLQFQVETARAELELLSQQADKQRGEQVCVVCVRSKSDACAFEVVTLHVDCGPNPLLPLICFSRSGCCTTVCGAGAGRAHDR